MKIKIKFEKVMNKHDFFLHNTIFKQKSKLNFTNKFFNIVARCPYRNLFAHLKTRKHTKWRISIYAFLESYRWFIKQNQFTQLIPAWLISRDLQNTNYGKIANFGFNSTIGQQNDLILITIENHHQTRNSYIKKKMNRHRGIIFVDKADTWKWLNLTLCPITSHARLIWFMTHMIKCLIYILSHMTKCRQIKK